MFTIDKNGRLKVDAGIVQKDLKVAVVIEDPHPGASEDATIFTTDEDVTISRIRAVIRGSSTPSITWTLRHSSDRDAAGTEVITSGTATTNTTTGDDITTFNSPTISSDNWLWLETTAKSGIVNELALTIFF